MHSQCDSYRTAWYKWSGLCSEPGVHALAAAAVVSTSLLRLKTAFPVSLVCRDSGLLCDSDIFFARLLFLSVLFSASSNILTYHKLTSAMFYGLFAALWQSCDITATWSVSLRANGPGATKLCINAATSCSLQIFRSELYVRLIKAVAINLFMWHHL